VLLFLKYFLLKNTRVFCAFQYIKFNLPASDLNRKNKENKMKKLFTLLLFYLVVDVGNATIRRVGYIASIQPLIGLDYNNFQAAHDASSTGDTIQLYSTTTGTITYTGTISKLLIILGPGYFTNSYTLTGTEKANLNLQNMPGAISSCTFSITLGSAGTIFQGINGLILNTVDQVNALNNITVNRCRNVSVSFANSGFCNGWIIAQCYGVTIVQTGPNAGFLGNRTINTLSIRNSVLFSGISFSTSPTGTYTGNTIYNCNFLNGASLSLNNAFFTVQNCIFENQSFTAVTNVSFINCLTTQSAAANPISTNAGSSGNLFSVVFGNIYLGYPVNPLSGGINVYSPDGRFVLKGGSPAINAGLLPGTGTPADCGIFGGMAPTTSPYILSGIPAIPAYYQLGAPSAVTTGSPYTITFSVRSNN
jgi:hypothetical protein